MLLAGAGLLPACLGRVVLKPPVQGPFLASSPSLATQESLGWLWGLAGGLALGLALALSLRRWRLSRARRAGAGRLAQGDVEMIQGALNLVEQVFTVCQRRMKVVDFDDWVARRKKKKQDKREGPPEL